MHKRHKLDNGIRVITHSMPLMRSVAVGIWLNVGGRYEEPRLKGMAHFLEHLVFKGTRKYSCRKIKESIEGVGGSLNGFTSEEFTCYLVKLPARHLGLALDILSDMAINPLFPQEEFERERTVIIEEIKMYKDLPQSYVYELLDELLWPAHPLGMSISGSIGSINQIQREDMVLFKGRYYTPLNIVVSATGKVDHNNFTQRVDKIFSSIKGRGINKFVAVKERQGRPQLKLCYKDTEQVHLALGFHAFHRDHPLRYMVALLHIILGANMSSRLFNELREKRGLAYEIGTNVKYFQDTGAFIVHAGIDNRKAQEAIELILKTLEEMKHNLITAEELKRAKEFYLGQLVLALEDTLNYMLWIGESTAALDKTYALDEVIQEIDKIKLQDIQEVAQRIFKRERINLALIGPLKDSERDDIYRKLRIE